jgi:Holliday junction resolvase RusA-like endonuclease
MTRIAFTILGEPASKANSRKIVTFGERAASIKSEKARNYEADALRQIPPAARVRLQGPLKVTATIFYASERPDLDESVLLDVLQDRWSKATTRNNGTKRDRQLLQAGVYRNDRQVRWKDIRHAIDRANPRAEVVVEPLVDQPPLPLVQQHVIPRAAVVSDPFAEVPF